MFKPWVFLPASPCPMLVAFQDPEIQLALNRLFPKPHPPNYSAQNQCIPGRPSLILAANFEYRHHCLISQFYSIPLSTWWEGVDCFVSCLLPLRSWTVWYGTCALCTPLTTTVRQCFPLRTACPIAVVSLLAGDRNPMLSHKRKVQQHYFPVALA